MGMRTIVIGTLTKKNVAAGTRNLRVTLTPAGKLALGTLSQVKLKITLAASSPRAKPVSLKGSLVVKS